MKKTILLLFFLLQIGSIAFSQTLYNTLIPDSSFNKFGYRRVFSSLYNPGFATAADGSMYVAAASSNQVYTASVMNLVVQKLNNSGQPDTAFGLNSNATINILAIEPNLNMLNIKSVHLQSDGKIVILAAAAMQLPNPQYSDSRGWHVLVRLKANGQPDSSFNGDGIVFTKVTTNNEDRPSCLTIDERVPGQPKYYVGGTSSTYGSWHLGASQFFIIRYLNNGTPDLSFNSTGYIQASGTFINMATGTGYVGAMSMKVVNNQKLLVAGAHASGQYFMMRLHPNGSFDSSFAGTGRVLRQVGFNSALNDLGATHILPDNSVAFTAEDVTYSNSMTGYDSFYLHVARQNADGTPMTGFGINGELQYNYTARGLYHKETFDDSSRMVLGYYRHTGSNTAQKINLVRFTKNGGLDASFASSGVLASEPILQDDWLNASSMIGGLQFSTDYKKLYLCGFYSKLASQGIVAYRYKYPVKAANTGVQQAPQIAATVYPNPVTDELRIQLAKPGKQISVQLTSCLGQVVWKGTFQQIQNISLPMQQLPSGTYFLRIANDEQQQYTTTVSKL